ncbi:MAG: hypothetical protein AAGE84_20220 [Cyanobacteria bacterium P01_G01_bin.39]
MTTIFPIRRWQIVKCSTILIAIASCLILLTNDINETSFRIAIRFTARTSCILFLLAFTASSLRRIQSNPLTNWLVTNRRYLGLSMAISHGFHALAMPSAMLRKSQV